MTSHIISASASSTISTDDEDESNKNCTKPTKTSPSKEFSPMNRQYESDKNGRFHKKKDFFSYNLFIQYEVTECNISNRIFADHSNFKESIGARRMEKSPFSNHMYHQNDLEDSLSSLSPRLPHPSNMSYKNSSSIKVSRDSGCFDDTSLTTLTISENSFPNRTSPTASDRSSHSAGLASHTDESGIHNMNEDCFFEEEENEKTASGYRNRNFSTDSKPRSLFLQPSEPNKTSSKRYSNIEPTSDKDNKYNVLVGKYGRGIPSGQSERITESKFNSVRSIFEQKTQNSLSSGGDTEVKKT